MLNGIPQPATETWGEPIPCNIKYNRSDHLGTYTDGRFMQLAATILIEPQQFDATHIKVTETEGNASENMKSKTCNTSTQSRLSSSPSATISRRYGYKAHIG